MTTITLSRQLGSGGDSIASRVSELLNYRLFDKNMILQVAAEVGLSESEIVDFSEDSHVARNFFERLFGGPRTVSRSRVWVESPGGVRTAQDIRLDDQSSVAITQASVQAAYRRGNVVIVGRGGQAILRGRKDVLHVRIVAPLEMRIARLVDEQFTSYETATQMVKQHDRASQDYLKHYYDIDWDDPLLYHMIINTGQCSVEMAAQWIQFAVQVMHL
ncbi:cytidylate kinase [Longilinea arvoryzae]|uniref:Cytidylate kinase n=1 Tax=Longilinea arvoryzae TaxID=360412 RepID=A0A0K8MY71_9CHLR|nr:cytidylate kinase-like family protein [Longilinea arvoryzae]GAP15971.1 cytidylate kinase [Longilinea arvoryzae]